MRECPKCRLVYDDSSKICRACGAILNEMHAEWTPTNAAAAPPKREPSPPIADLETADFSPRSLVREDWICTKCGETVPKEFDVCWNCTVADNPQDLGEPRDQGAAAAVDRPAVAPPSPLRPCSACGSDRVARGLQVRDEGQGATGRLRIATDASPDALIFKNRLHSIVVADVCGACGHIDLRVDNPTALYMHYLRRQSP